MAVLEGKKIVIKLPKIEWRSFLSIRFILLLALLLFASVFAYWYQNIRPYLWIRLAHVETVSSLISSDSAGRIIDMGPQEGDKIKKGQMLFILDRNLTMSKLQEVKASIDSINEEIEQEKERVGKAMEAYLTATAELELGVGSADGVKKQLALMEAAQEKSEKALSKLNEENRRLSLLNLELKKMTFLAPFDGVVLKRAKNSGSVVSFADPIYVICDPSQIWVEAEIPESEIGKIAIGTPACISLSSCPNKEFAGRVSYIGAATVAKSSLLPFSSENVAVPVKISLEKRDPCLKPGLSASVKLKVR